MSVFTQSAAAAVSGRLLRGMPTRKTNLMELFQLSVVQGVAAAAGCNVGAPMIDNGFDLDLTHELPNEEDVMLRVQLKAVTAGWNADRTRISATMSRQRYDRMRRANPSLHSVVVIMDLPSEQAHWSWSHHPYTVARHCCYWVSLEGAKERQGDTVTVSAAATNVFDDVALCQIMARIRAGGAP